MFTLLPVSTYSICLLESMLLTVLKILSTFEFVPEINSKRLAILHRLGNSSWRYVRTYFHMCFALEKVAPNKVLEIFYSRKIKHNDS